MWAPRQPASWLRHVRRFTCLRRLTDGRERRQHGLHRLQPERERERWPTRPGCGGERERGRTVRSLLERTLSTGGLLHRQKEECATLLYLSLSRILVHHSQMRRRGLRTLDGARWFFGHVPQGRSNKARELLMVTETFSEGGNVKKNAGGKGDSTEMWKQGREGNA